MRIRQDPELFQQPVAHALVTTFFGYALDGHHRVEADLANATVSEWVEQQAVGLQDEIRFAVDLSTELEALEPSYVAAVIGNFDASDWASQPIRLRPEDARPFLEAPFALLLEDAQSDRDFLLKMMTSQERAFVLGRVAKGLLRVDHGGGVENMRKRVQERREHPSAPYKNWLLFDSDAMQPGRPSAPSERLRLACADVPHHQLRRRYVESYIPAKALSVWAASGAGRDERRSRFAMLQAFLRMSAEQRHHFNMKGGFVQDARRTDASAGALYDGLGAPDRTLLGDGFGANIRNLFGSESVSEGELRRDSGWSELRPIILELVSRLR